MMNPIDKMLDDLCIDIQRDYNSPNDGFLLRVYSAEEMIEMGFCNKNVNQIMAEAAEADVEEYFERVVKNMKAEETGGLTLTDSTGIATVGQFVHAIKREAVRGQLNVALSAFIRKLKETNKEENNGKSE